MNIGMRPWLPTSSFAVLPREGSQGNLLDRRHILPVLAVDSVKSRLSSRALRICSAFEYTAVNTFHHAFSKISTNVPWKHDKDWKNFKQKTSAETICAKLWTKCEKSVSRNGCGRTIFSHKEKLEIAQRERFYDVRGVIIGLLHLFNKSAVVRTYSRNQIALRYKLSASCDFASCWFLFSFGKLSLFQCDKLRGEGGSTSKGTIRSINPNLEQ